MYLFTQSNPGIIHKRKAVDNHEDVPELFTLPNVPNTWSLNYPVDHLHICTDHFQFILKMAQSGPVTTGVKTSGAGGPGNTWLAQDDSTAQVTVRTFQFSTASGFTFVNVRGTTAFSILTIPDSEPLILNYVDPVTLHNETCSAFCPFVDSISRFLIQ
ncbi:hypothetical protein K439DRAFT_1610391 [Ramaria rubella]|nr:hypothetical protein K439DRAFT_1610391 [Ramaria rubella]